MLLSGCDGWGGEGVVITITLKIDLKVMMVKLMYTLTFHRLVKHLERLFTPKNQEKGHLVVSQTFDLNFLPFQGHKNHFSTGHF